MQVYCSNPVNMERRTAIRRGVNAAIRRIADRPALNVPYPIQPSTVETIRANSAACVIANALRYAATARS